MRSFILSLAIAIGVVLLGTLIVVAAQNFVGYTPTFPYAEMLVESPPWLYLFAQFDGVHYLTIVFNGYKNTGLIQAFFPVYPFLIASMLPPNASIQTAIGIGRLVSILSLVGCIMLWPYLRGFVQERKSLPYALAAFLLWPASFFLYSLYAESVFIVLVLASFILARKKQWLLAGILAGVASGTRIGGLFLFPALLIELWLQTRFAVRHLSFSQFLHECMNWLGKFWRQLLAISLSLGGWLLYSLYLNHSFGDFLLYYHVQQEFGGGRQESLVLLPQVLFRYAKIVWTVPFSTIWVVYAQELLLSLISIGALLIGWKYVRASLWFFSLCAVLLPTLTGTFSSMPRYILSAPAVFLILGYVFWKHRTVGYTALAISTALLFFNLFLYAQGLWVA